MLEDVGTEYGVGWSRLNYCGNRSLVNDEMIQLPNQFIIDDLSMDIESFGLTIGHYETYLDSDTVNIYTHSSEPLAKAL